MRTTLMRLAASLLTLVLGVRGAGAQSNSDINSGLQFNFTPPGAKSMGLGGAFSGMADDATAVYANPAGLTALSKPEASAELRHAEYKNTFPTGTPTTDKTLTNSATALGFASAVYPIQDWSFAAYYHRAADFTARIAQVAPNGGPDASVRDGKINLNLDSIGAAVAYKVTESLSLGLTLADYHSSLLALTSVTTLQCNKQNGCTPQMTNSHGVVIPQAGTPYAQVDTQSVSAGGDAFGGILGAHWSTNTWSLGLVYHRSPSFSAEGTTIGSRDVFTPDNLAVLNGGNGHFKVPDILSAGAGFQVTSSFGLYAELDHVWYSQLSHQLIPMLVTTGPLTCVTPGVSRCLAFSEPRIGDLNTDFKIDDGNELHLGGEYRWALSEASAIFIRAGAWHDPAHTLSFRGNAAQFPPLAARFPAGSAQTHGAGGIGFVANKHFQVDLGVDIASRQDSGSLSGVYRF